MRTLITTACIYFVLVMCAHAQLLPSRDRLTIEMIPDFPEANTPISLSVRSISMDLEQAYIEWYVNGELAEKGEGATSASVTLGNLGTKTTITVEALGEEVLTATRVISPAEVDIVWEAESYIPPFYKGRSLASSGTRIRAEAFPRLIRPDGKALQPRDIIFTWRRNGDVVLSASGRGKSTAILPGPELFGSATISVEAAAADSSTAAAATTFISSTNPFLVLYEQHPLFGGMFHRALKAETLIPDVEATFVAIPFFVNARNPEDSRLTYNWRVNSRSIETDAEDPSRITINAQNSDGNARIDLSLSHATDFTLDARGTWRLLLDARVGGGNSNLFGSPE